MWARTGDVRSWNHLWSRREFPGQEVLSRTSSSHILRVSGFSPHGGVRSGKSMCSGTPLSGHRAEHASYCALKQRPQRQERGTMSRCFRRARASRLSRCGTCMSTKVRKKGCQWPDANCHCPVQDRSHWNPLRSRPSPFHGEASSTKKGNRSSSTRLGNRLSRTDAATRAIRSVRIDGIGWDSVLPGSDAARSRVMSFNSSAERGVEGPPRPSRLKRTTSMLFPR